MAAGMSIRFAVLLATVSACSSEAPAKPGIEVMPATVTPLEPATPTALAGLGYQIDVPESWKLKKVSDRFFTFRLPSVKQGGVTNVPRLDVTVLPSGVRSVDAAAKGCANVVDKATLDGGSYYWVCEQQVAGLTIRNFSLVIPGDVFITCEGSSVDVAPILRACRTLRKLKA
jgi:hypothetical protein